MDILLVHSGALGDCVLAIHLARALRAAEPGATVTLAARSPIAKWAAHFGLIDHACELDDVDAHLLYAESGSSPALSAVLRDRSLIVSMLGGPDDPAARTLARLATGRVACLDPRPDVQTVEQGRHITAQWSDTLRAQGVAVSEIFPPPQRITPPGRMLFIHPGSGGVAKCCPLENLQALASALREAGREVAFLFGPAEEERFGRPLRGRLASHAPVAIPPSLADAASVIAMAPGYIGNDAGPTHVAALTGIPTVALFGPTDPRVWRPVGRSVAVQPFPAADESPDGFASRVIACLGALQQGA